MAATPYVKDIDAPAFAPEVLQRSHEVPVVVDFWAEWCGPCKQLSPVLEKLAAEYAGAFELVKIDVDNNQALAGQFGVQSIPTVLAFYGGQAVNQFTGALPEQSVRSFLDELIPTESDVAMDEARDLMLAGDSAAAEAALRTILAEKFDHEEAGTALASLLLAQGKTADALDVLAPLGSSPDVERLRATARLAESGDADVGALEEKLAADPSSEQARLELAQALAGKSEYEPALDHYLVIIRNGGPVLAEARQGMLDIFGILGPEHLLTATYRRELANALF